MGYVLHITWEDNVVTTTNSSALLRTDIVTMGANYEPNFVSWLDGEYGDDDGWGHGTLICWKFESIPVSISG